MKFWKVNPFDFRLGFLSLFILITGLGSFANDNLSKEGATAYLVMVAVFILALIVGSWGLGPSCNKLLHRTPLTLTRSSVFRARLIFLLAQFYYVYIVYQIMILFLTSGFSAFETVRTDIKEHISSYIYLPMQLISIVSICHEILYRNQKKYFSSIGYGFSATLKRKDFAILMVAIYIFENLLFVSRSLIFVSSMAFAMCWLRGSGRKLPVIKTIAFAFMAMSLFSFISFIRLFSNPDTFNWWVRQGYFDSFDLQEIGVFNAAWTMLSFTFGDMFYRPLVVIQHVLNGSLDHEYGGVSFFFLYSMLPGRQEDPGIMLNHQVFHSGTDAAIPATIVSQMYWDFGWFGVLLGGLLIGLIGRLLVKLSLSSLAPFFTVLFAMYFVQLILGIYGTFNIGLLVFYALLGVPIGLWISKGFRWQ